MAGVIAGTGATAAGQDLPSSALSSSMSPIYVKRPNIESESEMR